MSRLKRRIRTRTVRVAEQRLALAEDIRRVRSGLRERAAEPGWLAGAFGLGVFAGLVRRSGRAAPSGEPSAEPEGPSLLARLIREFGVPIALDLLQRYLSPPQAEEHESGDPAGAAPEQPP